ncbi:class I SAM-dependent methyltransferase [Halopelagius fulvigenes]|uniref:Class I SAM-dependent methyltransferase n=1 Tax=Halopelagius fulvigenes TaxID=1198324 RepID=A0ABD5TXH3_9EURY
MKSRTRDREGAVIDIFERTSTGTGSLLDVGCGDGDLTVRIGEAFGAEELYGVDVSPDAVERARERGLTAFRVDLDEETLPFDDDQFAAVHAGEVIDYLRDPDHLFGEVQRCLRPGGLFVLTTPNLASIHNRIALLFGKLPYPMRGEFDRLVGENEGPSSLSKRSSVFTYETLHSVLSAHDLHVLTVLGATSTPPEASTIHRLVETVAVAFPSLSYRNIFVCQNTG